LRQRQPIEEENHLQDAAGLLQKQANCSAQAIAKTLREQKREKHATNH
jgi:hypothetical protein